MGTNDTRVVFTRFGICIKVVLYYWRSGNTAELDFVIEDLGEIVPIEVKSAVWIYTFQVLWIKSKPTVICNHPTKINEWLRRKFKLCGIIIKIVKVVAAQKLREPKFIYRRSG